ncbi:MAG: hypothetical protein HKP44_12965 [Desulfofustis sp.]|nr:hypothetical protein [Desulfofustis sp.]
MQSTISQLLLLISDRWTENGGAPVDVVVRDQEGCFAQDNFSMQPEIGDSFLNYGRFARPMN